MSDVRGTPWWGRVLAGLAIFCAAPSLIFIPLEQMTNYQAGATGGREYVEMTFFFSGLFGPFLTPAAVVLLLWVLAMPGIRLRLRIVTAAIVAASVPATFHILKSFTAAFH
jgi:hypothetical protein